MLYVTTSSMMQSDALLVFLESKRKVLSCTVLGRKLATVSVLCLLPLTRTMDSSTILARCRFCGEPPCHATCACESGFANFFSAITT